MDTRMVAADFRLKQWFKIVQDRETSGLTIKAYCQEIGLREHQYYYMLKKVREVACGELSKIQNDMAGLAPSRNGSPVVWAGVDMNTLNAPSSLSMTDRSSTTNNIRISREGWTVTVEPGFDTGTLTEALRAVNRVCC